MKLPCWSAHSGPTHWPPMHLILHSRFSPSGPMDPENFTSLICEYSLRILSSPFSVCEPFRASSGGEHESDVMSFEKKKTLYLIFY